MIYAYDLTSEGVRNQDNSWCWLVGYCGFSDKTINRTSSLRL